MWLKRNKELKIDNPETLDESIELGDKILVKVSNINSWLECKVKAISEDKKVVKLEIENREPYYSFSIHNSNTWFTVKYLQIVTFTELPKSI